jgi:hypothetical protein
MLCGTNKSLMPFNLPSARVGLADLKSPIPPADKAGDTRTQVIGARRIVGGFFMKNYWEILGIKPTTDVVAIENAKSKLLKNSQPATDINAAFERAMAFANAWKPVSRQPASRPQSKNESLSKGSRPALYALGKPVGAWSSWWSR